MQVSDWAEPELAKSSGFVEGGVCHVLVLNDVLWFGLVLVLDGHLMALMGWRAWGQMGGICEEI